MNLPDLVDTSRALRCAMEVVDGQAVATTRPLAAVRRAITQRALFEYLEGWYNIALVRVPCLREEVRLTML
jgi:hypothetical protein